MNGFFYMIICFYTITCSQGEITQKTCPELSSFQELLILANDTTCDTHHRVWTLLNNIYREIPVCQDEAVQTVERILRKESNKCICEESVIPSILNNQKRQQLIPTVCLKGGCLALLNLLTKDNCQSSHSIWESLLSCPVSYTEEGSIHQCRNIFVEALDEKYGEISKYEKSKCFCFRSSIQIDQECLAFNSFRELQKYADENRCATHTELWENFALIPTHCEDLLINYMLSKYSQNANCSCQNHVVQDVSSPNITISGCTSFGFKELFINFTRNPCISHWHVWKHLADIEGYCRRLIVDNLFALSVGSTHKCSCINLSNITLCNTCNSQHCNVSTPSICLAEQPYCLTTVDDRTDQRVINRRCATYDECNSLWWQITADNPNCYKVETNSSQTTCSFCCTDNNCNSAPGLIPDRSSILIINNWET